ncbi:MAG: hypothetical protein K8R60_09740 [Burkholderiales bacterium]|nr:hypothetical protein [Burkholderiales bacterium]
MKSKDWRPTAFVETAPGVVGEAEAEARRGEQRSSLLVLLRQFVALHAAALLLTVALVGRSFAQPVQRGAVAIAIAAFLAGTVAAGVAHFSALPGTLRVGSPHVPASGTRALASVALGVFIAFALGLAGLSVFFFANWFR